MKQESNVRYVLRLALTLLAICAVVSALLAGVNALTKDRIAAIKAEKTAKAISAVLKNGETAVEVPYTTEGDTIVTKVYQNENGYAVLAPSKTADFPAEQEYKVKTSDGEITVIDYASAGQSWDPNLPITVWIKSK